MFFEGGNASETFMRPQGYTQCILVRNTNGKHNCVCLEENSTGLL